VAIFAFGTTFLWFMPSFLGPGATANGPIWSLVQLLVVVTVATLALAAWGVYKASACWKPVAIAGAIAGTAVLAVWGIAASAISGVTNMATNLGLHAIGLTLLLLALLRPLRGRGLNRRLGAHPGSRA
jgi:hypothetical protein